MTSFKIKSPFETTQACSLFWEMKKFYNDFKNFNSQLYNTNKTSNENMKMADLSGKLLEKRMVFIQINYCNLLCP